MLKIPGEPSESERRLHELTHLPYRDWCEHCVKSKGRQTHAVKKNDRQPVVQIDFSFLSTENDLPKRTILNATDVQTGYAMAIVLSVPWQPKVDGVDSTAFVMPPDLGVKGRVKPPPGLARIEEEDEENEQLEDLAPGQSESLTVQDLLKNDGSDRAPAETVHES